MRDIAADTMELCTPPPPSSQFPNTYGDEVEEHIRLLEESIGKARVM